MTGEVSRQAKAAETKKRRTREKLIHAADYVMREVGMSATVEALAEEAGVSTATFYTFYPSRDALCLDAVLDLVVTPLEAFDVSARPFMESADALLRQCEGRSMLLRAALLGRLNHASDYDLVERTATVLSPGAKVKEYNEGATTARHRTLMTALALWLLDAIAMERQADLRLSELDRLVGRTLPRFAVEPPHRMR